MRETLLKVLISIVGGLILLYSYRFLVLATRGHPRHAVQRLFRRMRPWPTLIGVPLTVFALLTWFGESDTTMVVEARDGLGDAASQKPERL
jgi:hypothetical protein